MATLTVTAATDAGPGSLRAAIASAGSGDTIAFAPALSGHKVTLTSGPLTITKNLTIKGPGSALLNYSAGGVGSVFAIHPATPTATTPPISVAISGLEIADGSASEGGGIDATQAKLSLSGDALVNNQVRSGSDGGGGVYFAAGRYPVGNTGVVNSVAGALLVYGTTFRGNSGSALTTIGSFPEPVLNASKPADPTAIVASSSFTDNGGTAIFSGTALKVQDSRFTGNRSDSLGFGSGGAIDSHGGAVTTVIDSWFGGNVSQGMDGSSGGAIFGEGNSTLNIQGSTFVANQALTTVSTSPSFGGAVAGNPGTSLTIEGSTFLDNIARSSSDAEGGAVWNYGGSFSNIGATITNSTFTGNQAETLDSPVPRTASARGGAILSSGDFLVVSNVDIIGNQALAASGGVKVPAGIAVGGGIDGTSGRVTLSNSLFSGNLARGGSGGGPYDFAGGFADGGGMSESIGDKSVATISNTQFIANSAVGGAGIGTSSGGGQGVGGGLIIVSSGGMVTLTDVSAIGNSAIGGAGGPAGTTPGVRGGIGGEAQGGGLALDAVTATVSGGQVIGNIARGGDSPAGVAGPAQGAGIYSGAFSGAGEDSTPHLTLTGTILATNQASGGAGASGGDAQGGGLFVANVVALSNDTITDNQAQGGPSGHGAGGGEYLATATRSTVDKATRIVGNQASTAGNDVYTG